MAGLRETLANMISAARAKTNDVTRVRLAKGLTIAMKADGDLLAVQLSRADVYPSTREWKTVLDCMPAGSLTVVEGPRPILAKNIYYLKGKVRLTEALL